jgi:hypothetical protein
MTGRLSFLIRSVQIVNICRRVAQWGGTPFTFFSLLLATLPHLLLMITLTHDCILLAVHACCKLVCQLRKGCREGLCRQRTSRFGFVTLLLAFSTCNATRFGTALRDLAGIDYWSQRVLPRPASWSLLFGLGFAGRAHGWRRRQRGSLEIAEIEVILHRLNLGNREDVIRSLLPMDIIVHLVSFAIPSAPGIRTR